MPSKLGDLVNRGLTVLMLISFAALMIYVIVTMLCAIGIRCLSAGLVYFYSLYSLEVFATPLRAKAMGIITSGDILKFITKYCLILWLHDTIEIQ